MLLGHSSTLCSAMFRYKPFKPFKGNGQLTVVRFVSTKYNNAEVFSVLRALNLLLRRARTLSPSLPTHCASHTCRTPLEVCKPYVQKV